VLVSLPYLVSYKFDIKLLIYLLIFIWYLFYTHYYIHFSKIIKLLVLTLDLFASDNLLWTFFNIWLIWTSFYIWLDMEERLPILSLKRTRKPSRSVWPIHFNATFKGYFFQPHYPRFYTCWGSNGILQPWFINTKYSHYCINARYRIHAEFWKK